jgi:flavin reductase (DIM6/NTAB) family NADH-FMN oxidoreductase RutF
MGQLPTGVCVITTRTAEGTPFGVTVGSFTSLSLDPCLVMWSLAVSSSSMVHLAPTTRFGANILAHDQEHVSRTFSSRAERFASVEWTEGEAGVPLLEGAVVQLELALEASLAGGDHRIFVARVLRTHMFDRIPLIHWRGAYAKVEAA